MSLRARLLAAFAYALLIVIVALMVPLASNLSDRVNAEVRADSAAQAQVVAASVADQLGRPARLREVADEASARLGGRVFVVDGRGRLLADSSDEAEIGSLYASDAHPPLLEALRGEIGQGTHPPDLEDLSTAVPIVRNGRTIGALEVEQSLASVNDEVRSDVLTLIGVAVLALALGLGVAWILAGSISGPINALAAAAPAHGGRRSLRARRAGRVQRAGRGRERVQRDGRPARGRARVPALLRRRRLPPAPDSPDGHAPEARGRRREGRGGTETAAEIEAAERETERLSAVVGDLLALASSEEPAEPQRGDLRAAASAAVARWEDPAAEQGHGVLATGDGELEVRAGEGDLAVILDNLVENAIKYSPRGSTVEIDWGADGDRTAALRVANEGGPLTDEERRRAFERFYRGPGGARRRGTGLGLPIVAALARRSGGRARLSNRPGGGVVAEVTLPRSGFADS